MDPEEEAGNLEELLIVTPEEDAGNAELDAGTDNTADAEAEGTDAGNPDTGTDEEADAEADGEAAEGEEGTDTEPKYTVKRDGKEFQVSLKEALEGYQRQDDYTRKTQEVSEARKAADTELAAVRATRTQYAGVLEALQAQIGPADQEPTQEQWNTLQRDEPERYAVEWANHQRRAEQRTVVSAEQKRVADEAHADRVKQANEFVAGERVKLLDKLPAWKEPAKFEAGLKANREYAVKSLGFAEEEVNAAYDHRFVVAIDKARQFDALVARQKAAKTKLAAAPDMPAPGVRTQPNSRRATERAAAEKQLDKTGKAEDAAALLVM